MRFITFNPLRTVGIPDSLYIKPEHMLRHKEEILQADWILFPEYWQVNTLVYGLHKKVFPSMAAYHLGHNKVEMTRVFQAICPEHMPYTEIHPSTPSAIEQLLDTFSFPFIAKEIRNSMGRGVFLIENEKGLRDYALRNDVLYVQEKLDIDRDLRITLVGKKVIGAYWRIGRDGNHLNNVSQGGEISYDPVPREAIDLVERVADELGIDHAGFDVAMVNGHPYFFEFNVLFGNIGLNQLDISIEEHILSYLNNLDSGLPPFSPLTPMPPYSKKTS
ncbi:hypothetical protein PU629_01250 [Pullulanibacillus sp. KACC 23026]|uniref:ATP-grasp domain-containing protein n=1 Tax=Pullulanibacillus sp. KACC 23026 TaxID=3028315 RepID=UPI0023B0058E|nr:hypothetical protein [Pullulanibacillus sp. KACC 23026]WEG13013.1 hypothetical protein PU629_01250 [Pullulanibacillus sp. KACC 23026]